MTGWSRSEAVDVTAGDYTFRMAPRALYSAMNGTVMAKLSMDAAAVPFQVTAKQIIPGDFVAIEKAGTTATELYGLTQGPALGSWEPDHAVGLIHWVTADDPNIVPASVYWPDRVAGPPGGLTATGAVSWNAAGISGKPAFVLNGGRMQTPSSASAVMCSAVSGSFKPFCLFARLQWNAITTNDTLFCWGNDVGVSLNALASGPAVTTHRYRRVATDGTVGNRDGALSVPATPYTVMLLNRGRSVRLDVDGVTIYDAAQSVTLNPVAATRFVLGNLLSNGVYSQTAKFSLAEEFTYETIPDAATIAAANAYLARWI